MATAARDLVPVTGKAKKVDGRKNNRGVVGNRGNRQAKIHEGMDTAWQPKPMRKETPQPGVFREETQEEAWERARQAVRHYVAIGYPQEVICRLMEPTLHPNTLRKWFPYELENGKLVQDAKVAGTAYWMATNGRHADMTRFWCRARLGWRDTGEMPSNGLEVNFTLIDGDEW